MSFETDPLLREQGLEPHEAEAIRIVWRVRRGLPPRLRVEGDHDISADEALEILGEVRARQQKLERVAREVAFSRLPIARWLEGRQTQFLLIGLGLVATACLVWMLTRGF